MEKDGQETYSKIQKKESCKEKSLQISFMKSTRMACFDMMFLRLPPRHLCKHFGRKTDYTCVY